MKRPNKRHRRWINELYGTDNEGRLTEMILNTPGVRDVYSISGYYGSVRVTMWDGYEIVVQRRYERSWSMDAFYEAAVEAYRYYRRRKKRRRQYLKKTRHNT